MTDETPRVMSVPGPLVRLTSLDEFITPEGQRFYWGHMGQADVVLLANPPGKEPTEASFFLYVVPRDWGAKPKKGSPK